MRILFKTADRSELMVLNIFHHLEQRVFEIVDCSKEGEAEDFDWVVTIPWTSCAPLPPTTFPKNRGYKTCAIISDLHWHRRFGRSPKGLVKYLNENYDLVLTMYGEMNTDPDFYQKHMKIPYMFFPPWVDMDFYHPSDKPSLYDVVLIGGFGSARVYGFRHDVARNLPRVASQNNWRILVKQRPKGLNVNLKIKPLYERGEFVGERYVEALGRTRVMMSGSSVYKYPLLRYFEGMACRTCVVGTGSPKFVECGFEDGVNYWRTIRRRWDTDVKYLLEHEEYRQYIADMGHRLVLERHTAKQRAKDLVEQLKVYS